MKDKQGDLLFFLPLFLSGGIFGILVLIRQERKVLS